MTKKPYLKPMVSKVDAEILRMISKEGFTELFWEKLKKARKEDPRVTHEIIFEQMNRKWFDAFKSYRYSDYNSFRRRMNEKIYDDNVA